MPAFHNAWTLDRIDKGYRAADILEQCHKLEVIDGGAHVIMYEKPYYHAFQDNLIGFLEKK